MDAVTIVSDEVRAVIRQRGIDPVRDEAEVRLLVEACVADYDERSLVRALPPLADASGAVKAVLAQLTGFGPLQPYFDDPAVEEIWINEPNNRRYSRGPCVPMQDVWRVKRTQQDSISGSR